MNLNTCETFQKEKDWKTTKIKDIDQCDTKEQESGCKTFGASLQR